MKKAMSSKNKKTRNNNLEIDIEAVKILRTVGEREAFYFYEAVGKPTGEIARSLADFIDKVKSVKSESLLFHLQRNDFQSWVEKVLGDSKLAGKLARLSSSNSGDIRMSICKTVDDRIKELGESSVAMLDGEKSTLVLPSF